MTLDRMARAWPKHGGTFLATRFIIWIAICATVMTISVVEAQDLTCEMIKNSTTCAMRSDCLYFKWPKKHYPQKIAPQNRKPMGCVTVPVVNCGIFWSKKYCLVAPANATCAWAGGQCLLQSEITTSPSMSPIQLSGCQRYDETTCSSDPACKLYNGVTACKNNGLDCRTMNYGCQNATDFCDFKGKYQSKQCAFFPDTCMWDDAQSTCTQKITTSSPTTYPPTPAPICAQATDLKSCDLLGPECRYFGLVRACDDTHSQCYTSYYGCQSKSFCTFNKGKFFSNQCKLYNYCFFDAASNQCMFRPATIAPTFAPTPYPTTRAPTFFPTYSPSVAPTNLPSRSPSKRPTQKPTKSPTGKPSKSPTTSLPTATPSKSPSRSPSRTPSATPSVRPTGSPTNTACVNAADQATCNFLAGDEGRCEWIAPIICDPSTGRNCKTYFYGCQDRGFCGMTLPGFPRLQCAARKSQCMWNTTKALCVDLCDDAPPKAPFVRANCASSTIPLTLNSVRAIRYAGTLGYDWAGKKVTGDADLDGDGGKDFAIGSPNANPHMTGRPGRGWINIILKSMGYSDRGKSVANRYMTSDQIRINGTLPEGNFGEQMAFVDLDGDNLDDLIVSAPYASPLKRERAGQVYIIWGQANFSAVWASGVYSDIEAAPSQYVTRIMGEGGPQVFGSDIARAGDFDKDGYQDVIIGARESGVSGRSFCGEAIIIFGGPRAKFAATTSALEIRQLRTFRILGLQAFTYLGTSVSGGRDFNNDGIADVVVGAPWVDNGIGSSYVVFGRQKPFASIDLLNDPFMVNGAWNFLLLQGEKSVEGWATFGSSVAMVGDVNVDGIDDVVVGAPFFSSIKGVKEVGRTYVYFGTKDPVKSINVTALTGFDVGFYMDGIGPGDQFGASIASGFLDFNGDGYADLLIGSPYRNTQVALGGQATVIYGRCQKFPARLSLVKPWASYIGTHINGQRQAENFGISVESGGDVDGDGRSDLLIGGHFSEKQRGAAYLIFSC